MPNAENDRPRVAYSHGRLIVRRLPGFNWIQVGVAKRWRWDRKGYWAVRGFAKTRHFGPFWLCTMRSDAIERGKRSGVFPPGSRYHSRNGRLHLAATCTGEPGCEPS